MTPKLKKAGLWISVSSFAQIGNHKISMKDQEAKCRQWCLDNGYSVVDVMRVDGFPRSDANVPKALKEFERLGVKAYAQLEQHWEDRDIDMLVCYHDSRLGRSAGLYTHALENTILSGIQIHRILGGLITRKDQRIQNALGIIAATTDLDRLVEARAAGMEGRASRGQRTGHSPARFFVDGADGKLEPDPATRHIVQDAAKEYLEGVSYYMFERHMYDKYGYGGENNRPYSQQTFYGLFHDPRAYGHAVWGYRRAARKGSEHSVKFSGLWLIDPIRYPPPDDIKIYPNQLKPQWEGDLLEMVKQEYIRRHQHVKGNRRPHKTYPFSGIMVCAECGYAMRVSYRYAGTGDDRHIVSYYHGCTSRYFYRDFKTKAPCNQKTMIKFESIQEWFDIKLSRAKQANDIKELFGIELPENDLSNRIEIICKEINDLEKAGDNLIRQFERIAPSMAERLHKQIDAIAAKAESKRNILMALEYEFAKGASNRKQQSIVWEEMRAMKLEDFWKLPYTQINQRLLALIGDLRLFVEDGQIIGWGHPNS